MRILIAAEIYHPMPVGSAIAAYRLATGLAKRGHTVAVITTGHHISTQHTTEDGVEVYRLAAIPNPLQREYSISPLANYLISDIMDKFKPDLVHIEDHFFVAAPVAIQAVKRGIPLVATNHFHPDNLLHHLKLPAGIEDKVRGWMWNHFKWIYSKVSIISTPTETAKKIIEDIGIKKEVRVISNGIEVGDFKPIPFAEAKAVLAKYHIPENEKRILFVGRLEKEKSIDLLIRALPTIRKSVSACLIIAGMGSEKQNLLTLAEDLKVAEHVKLLGKITDDDLRNLYNAVDVFSTASTVELQGLVVMEAMASGLPVVTSKGMALYELVTQGENGYWFENNDVDDAAAKLVKVLSDDVLRKRMGENSRRFIQEHDVEKSLDQYERMYRDAMAMKVETHSAKS